MSKIEKILDLISEKTSALHDELEMVQNMSDDAMLDGYDGVLISQIEKLDELYKEVKLIQAEDE